MPYLSNLFGSDDTRPSFYVGNADMLTWRKPKVKIHLFALGDVGAMVLIGLRLMGGDVIREIGIYDVRDHVPERWAFECNQIMPPVGASDLPLVRVVKEEELFDCDVFLFCASLRVPPVAEQSGDVRMAQFEVNAGLMKQIAGRAAAEKYTGLFGVVSDPVDPLCKVAVLSGLKPERVKGFGLGVMNARACYYASMNEAFAAYLTEGRAYGPHGEDLVIANSLTAYDNELSLKLTDLTAHANLEMRRMGFKPYVAPAMSSAALTVCAMLRGEWNYSSVWMDGVYFGAKNRCTLAGFEVENPDLPEELYARCQTAYENLKGIV